MNRQALAALIGGQQTEICDPRLLACDQLFAVAVREDVVSLAHSVLSDYPEPHLRDCLRDAAKFDAVRSLVFEAEIRRVLTHLDSAGLAALLLKGSSLAHWLYPSPNLRRCADIDLLLSSQAEAERAALQLEALGYRRRERALPGDLTTYEVTCVREVAGISVEVDVHWGIGGAPVFAARLGVDELFAAAMPLPRLSPLARGLSPVHALMHAAMHRALNLHLVGDRLKWLYDLHLLSAHFSAADWRHLQELSAERGLAGTCLSALRASQEQLGTLVPAEVIRTLAEAAEAETLQAGRMGEWRYIQQMNLRALPGWRIRLRWLRQRLLPAPGYMEDMYGEKGGVIGSWWRYLRHGFSKLRS